MWVYDRQRGRRTELGKETESNTLTDRYAGRQTENERYRQIENETDNIL